MTSRDGYMIGLGALGPWVLAVVLTRVSAWLHDAKVAAVR